MDESEAAIRLDADLANEKIEQKAEIKAKHRDPFEFTKIDDSQFLNDIDGRSPCVGCGKSRKFFCYTCYLPVEELQGRLPVVKLPLKIDIIKHHKEVDGKSTAIHAAILAAEDVKIYTYPDIPDYQDDDGVVLIFPSHNSVHVDGIFDAHVRLQKPEEVELPKGINRGTLLKYRLNEVVDEQNGDTQSDKRRDFQYSLDNLPIKRAVFIDSTWNQCRSIYKDDRINKLRPVVLQNRLSQFWRHQKKSPRWFLATIEAIHQFLLEVHINAFGLDSRYQLDALEVATNFIREDLIVDVAATNNEENSVNCDSTKPYNGQYDNLLFFFAYMYSLIHHYYDHNLLLAYRRPIF